MLSQNMILASPASLFRSAARSHISGEDRRGSLRIGILMPAVLLMILVTTGLASAAPPLNSRLDSIVRRDVPENCSVSVQVADLETGRILMEKNPDLPLVPASTMKIVTSATALQVLNPDFTFLTEVLADGVRGSSVGTIFLRGTGDPYLVSEELFALTRAVREKGVTEVRGNIVVDDSYFIPDPPLDENEKLGPRSYHAPYSALSLNFNTIKVMVHPGGRAGEPATVTADPVSEYAVVRSDVKTVKGSKPAQIKINKETAGEDRETVYVEGLVGEQTPSKGRYVNVSSPALYTGEVFKEFLLREGIKVNGKVIHGRVPSSAVSILEFNSRPLGSVIYWLNKFSNNFMAEQICLALGAKIHGAPGTREKGLSVTRKHLVSCGIPEANFSLSDSSGLSRNNRLSASALVRVLLAAAKDFSYSAEFMASMGIAGVDGTLKEKFADPSSKRRLRAKTGTLRGVNALAGYGISPDRRVFVFAVIVNSNQKGAGLIDYADNTARAILEIPLNRHAVVGHNRQ